MKRKVLILANSTDRSSNTANMLEKSLSKREFLSVREYEEDIELIIAIGGDGAFINALQQFNFPDIPIAGINTGTLGFFQDILPENIEKFLDDYTKKEYTIQKIYPIDVIVEAEKKKYKLNAINEMVIKSDAIRTIHLNLSINESFIEKFSGDGIIVSTSAGSTAYNYSAGGTIVDPSLRALQITPLAPINTNAYRSFTSSIICSESSTIQIRPEDRYENSVTIAVDGIMHDIKKIENVQITTSKKNVNLVRTTNYQFWKKVTEKFL